MIGVFPLLLTIQRIESTIVNSNTTIFTLFHLESCKMCIIGWEFFSGVVSTPLSPNPFLLAILSLDNSYKQRYLVIECNNHIHVTNCRLLPLPPLPFPSNSRRNVSLVKTRRLPRASLSSPSLPQARTQASPLLLLPPYPRRYQPLFFFVPPRPLSSYSYPSPSQPRSQPLLPPVAPGSRSALVPDRKSVV